MYLVFPRFRGRPEWSFSIRSGPGAACTFLMSLGRVNIGGLGSAQPFMYNGPFVI